MENKLLIELLIPSSRETIDVFISADSLMFEVLELIKNIIKASNLGNFITDSNTVLCDANTGQVYNLNKYVYEVNIQNGSKLMVV